MKSHNNNVAIAKGMCIIFMVMGHSHPPYFIEKVIYSFHMPFFFFVSGYFFSSPSQLKEFRSFAVRKIKGLYLPFIEWCVIFTLLHNVFYRLNIYNDTYGFHGQVSHLFSWQEFASNLISHVLFMDKIPVLLGGFWFLKDLFLSSIAVALLSISCRKIENKIIMLLASIVCISIIFSYLPCMHFVKDLLWASTFFVVGFLFKDIKITLKEIIICLVIFVMVNFLPFRLEFFAGGVLMPLTFLTSVSGSILLLEISKKLEKYKKIRVFFYYAGNHTLIILGLHFLCFNIVDLIIISNNRLSFLHLGEHPVMHGYDAYWLAYTL